MATPAALGVILTLIMSSNYVELCDLYNLQSMGFVYFIIQYSLSILQGATKLNCSHYNQQNCACSVEIVVGFN